MSRDNTKRSRGFIYQRQYAIYYFLNNCDSLIIEEGTLNNKVYEDITIKHNNDILVTYQIKHHNLKGLLTENIVEHNLNPNYHNKDQLHSLNF